MVLGAEAASDELAPDGGGSDLEIVTHRSVTYLTRFTDILQ